MGEGWDGGGKERRVVCVCVCVCVCVKRDGMGGVNTGRSKWSTRRRVTAMETELVQQLSLNGKRQDT